MSRKELKQLSKAQKVWARTVKQKVFTALVRQSELTEVYQRYATKLKATALASMKKYWRKRVVKKLKEQRAYAFRRAHLQRWCLFTLSAALITQRPANMKKRELLKMASDHVASRLVVKGLKALKKYAYWRRVCQYLEDRCKHQMR